MQRSTTKERMQEVLGAIGVSSTEFENKCGLAHGFVARVTREITKKTRAKIKAVYPELNIDYIALGIGDIFESPEIARETIKERLMQFIASQNITKKEFAQKVGVSDSFITNMSESVRSTTRERILRAYPKLNPEWLWYGEGEMLLNNPRKKSVETLSDRVKRLIEFLGITTTAFKARTGITSSLKNATNNTIEKIVMSYPFINPIWLMEGAGEMYYSRVNS